MGREIRLPFKCLCINNEGEYTSQEFKTYYSNHGVRHEKIVLDPPQWCYKMNILDNYGESLMDTQNGKST